MILYVVDFLDMSIVQSMFAKRALFSILCNRHVYWLYKHEWWGTLVEYTFDGAIHPLWFISYKG
jgi:hypothetical protein